MQEK
ncbi:hypothetical protein EC960939_1568, partial [Escherichia coli 96.0939]|jgi:hypothetical protein